MSSIKRVLLKLTGTVFLSADGTPSTTTIETIAQQIKTLKESHYFGIVIGGGNFFRGASEGKRLALTPSIGHHIGMLATMMNGLAIKDIFERCGLPATLLTALSCPAVGATISGQEIDEGIQNKKVLIFVGGTGAPFFTTDTNAVIRALQIDATQIWKATDVDGVYATDPTKDPNAVLIKTITYKEVLKQKNGVMDETAFILAQKHKKVIRVFNVFTPDALLKAAREETFGSIIS